MQHKKFGGITFFVLIYMLLAFIWWSVLLFQKNRDAYRAKIELQKIGMAAEGLIHNEEDFLLSTRYLSIKSDYQRQEIMIFGETVALSLSILLAMFIVYRSYRKELMVSQQQRNFLLSITHELKSPIASARLSLETIFKQHSRLTPVQIKRLTQNGTKDIDRLNRLVEDILLSARLENAYQFHKQTIDFSTLLEKKVNHFINTYAERTFELSIDEPLPKIIGDEQALDFMVTNLIENAIKYSPDDEPVSLSLSQKNTHYLKLTVADRGIGISDREKRKVFDKFYRIGNEDTRKTKGTGLGLFIVKEIVKGHKGKIEITNNEKKGSVFSILLPLS